MSSTQLADVVYCLVHSYSNELSSTQLWYCVVHVQSFGNLMSMFKAMAKNCIVQYTFRSRVSGGFFFFFFFFFFFVVAFFGCLTSKQHTSVSQGQICTDNFTFCHTQTEAADQAFYLSHSQYIDSGPTSPSADPINSDAWQDSHRSANF